MTRRTRKTRRTRGSCFLAVVAMAWAWQSPAQAQPGSSPPPDGVSAPGEAPEGNDVLEACLRTPETCPDSFPPPPPTGVFRAFSLTFAGGAGALFGPGESDLAVSHNLIRVGWGPARNLSLYVSFEGARAPAVHPRTHVSSWLRHDTVTGGVQYHFSQRAYVRGGLGMSWVGEQVGDLDFSGGSGVAAVGAVGFDLLQLSGGAISVEVATTAARYPREWWESAGLNLAVTLF
jgi:hypothetical protein